MYSIKEAQPSSNLKPHKYLSALLMTLVNITEVLRATSPPPVTQDPVGAASGDSKWDMMGIGDFLFLFLFFFFKSCYSSHAFSFRNKIYVKVVYHRFICKLH